MQSNAQLIWCFSPVQSTISYTSLSWLFLVVRPSQYKIHHAFNPKKKGGTFPVCQVWWHHWPAEHPALRPVAAHAAVTRPLLAEPAGGLDSEVVNPSCHPNPLGKSMVKNVKRGIYALNFAVNVVGVQHHKKWPFTTEFTIFYPKNALNSPNPPENWPNQRIRINSPSSMIRYSH